MDTVEKLRAKVRELEGFVKRLEAQVAEEVKLRDEAILLSEHHAKATRRAERGLVQMGCLFVEAVRRIG